MPVNSYSFKINSISIGNHTVRIAQLENPEALFDELLNNHSEHEDIIDERIPYWGELWPSSIGLSEFLSAFPELVQGKKVIEIGCGLGLAGIVAVKCGAEVTLTDYLPAAIEFATYNWELNFSSQPQVKILDWRSPKGFTPADVLLASDVAYESRSFKPLLKAMKMLINKNGKIIISEPNRNFAKEFINEFKNEKFSVTSEIRNIVKDSIKYKISIYLLEQIV